MWHECVTSHSNVSHTSRLMSPFHSQLHFFRMQVYVSKCISIFICIYIYIYMYMDESRPKSMARDTTWFMLNLNNGLATISRLLKITGLFCKRALSKRTYSAKETYNFKEPTNRSHPIDIWGVLEESTKHDVIYVMYELVTSYVNSSHFM